MGRATRLGPRPVRVALVNDFEIVLEGLRVLLRAYRDQVTVVDLAVQETPHRAVDLSLFDTYGVSENVENRVQELVRDRRAGVVVVFSFSEQPWYVDRVVAAGAQGFISKTAPADAIVRGILAAARGEVVRVRHGPQGSSLDRRLQWPGRDEGLTVRESELLALLPSGMTNREIAETLYVSENTVKTQLRRLFAKIGVRNRTQAALLANDGRLGAQLSKGA